MRYQVVLTRDAEADLKQIYHYIAEYDSQAHADHVLERLLDASDSLASQPQRGSVPKELRSLGMAEYRQVLFKPYRLIYRIHGNQVVIYLVTDGRRDMQSLLARRMLGA